MGQSTSEIIEDQCFELYSKARSCQKLSEKLFQDQRDLHYKAKQLVQKGEEEKRAISYLQQAALKGKQGMEWAERASSIDKIRQEVYISKGDADATKILLLLTRVMKNATRDPLETQRELDSLDDTLAAFGAGGRDILEERGADPIDVSMELRKLQDEVAVLHDLPVLTPSVSGIATSSVQLGGGGGGIR